MPVRSLPAAQWNTAGAVDVVEIGHLLVVPGGIDDRHVVVGDRVAVVREGAVLFDLEVGTQVDHGAHAQGVEPDEVGLGEPVQAVGTEQHTPPGDPIVHRRVAPEVTEVVDGLELDVAVGVLDGGADSSG